MQDEVAAGRSDAEPLVANGYFGRLLCLGRGRLGLQLAVTFDHLYLLIQLIEPLLGLGVRRPGAGPLFLLQRFHLLFQVVDPPLELLDQFDRVGVLRLQGDGHPQGAENCPRQRYVS